MAGLYRLRSRLPFVGRVPFGCLNWPLAEKGLRDMQHAYAACHLEQAMTTLAEAMEYAVQILEIPGPLFLQQLEQTGLLQEAQSSDLLYQPDMDGRRLVEMMTDRLGQTSQKKILPPYWNDFSRYKDYWAGKSLAYLQWYLNIPYAAILEILPYQRLIEMYPSFHAEGESALAAWLKQELDQQKYHGE